MKKSSRVSKKKAILSLHSPHAENVFVAGTFNDWDPHKDPLKKNTKGQWKTAKYLEPGIYEYRFVVDGVWMDDPSCKSRRSNQYGGENCILEL
jgi:1,4-alpha-glucan branching enzyme